MAFFSIRKTIPLLVVTPLVVAIAFVSSLSIHYNRRSVNQLSADLMQSTTNRVQDQFSGLMREPWLINSINASAIENGELSVENWLNWGNYFSSQLQAATDTNYVYIGTEGGHFAGSRVQHNQQFVVLSDPNVSGLTYQYDVDESGRISTTPSREYTYDPRVRPWYQLAAEAQQPIWSKVYIGFSAQELLVTASYPIYDERNQLIAVLGTDMFVSEMNQFLDELEVGKTGEVFVMEQNGALVASSIGKTVDIQPSADGTPQGDGRVSAFESSEPIIRDTADHLLEEYDDLSLMENNIRITRKVNGENTFIAARPFRDHLGLEWLIVVVVPTQDFTGPMRTQAIITVIFALSALTISVGIGWMIARWIVSPLLQLHGAALDVQSQQYESESLDYLVQRDDEIGQFAGVFLEMAELISQREESLEEQLKHMRLQVAGANGQRAFDLAELKALQKRAKVIREMQNR